MVLKVLLKKLASIKRKKLASSRNPDYQIPPDPACIQLTQDININAGQFAAAIGTANDIQQQEFFIGSTKQKAVIFYIDGMADIIKINDAVIRPLKVCTISLNKFDDIAAELKNSVIQSSEITVTNNCNEMVSAFMSGDTVLFVDGSDYGMVIGTKGFQTRGISEPQTELVVRGPREGFTEDFRTNTTLIRRRIKSTELKMESMVLGHKTQTNVCIFYIKDVANDTLVEEVRRRLLSIDVDAIIDSGYVEEYIEDSPLSLFPTVGYTEKPDVAAAKVLEGRIGIIVDGSPFVLTVPFLFVENLQTAEDYYIRPLFATFLRFMRLLAYFISIFLVPMYLAMTTFHQELIPTTLLFTIVKAREGTPFPALGEALILILSFEILREAGLRLPRPVGQAMSIVGALIMGDAAVAAGLVGAPMVIAVAISAVSGFIIPEQVDTISVLRYLLMVLAVVLGGFGIAIGFLGILTHLASTTTFGVPYFNTFIPTRDQQDTLARVPLWLMTKRPQNLLPKNIVRNTPSVPPPFGEIDKSSNGMPGSDQN